VAKEQGESGGVKLQVGVVDGRKTELPFSSAVAPGRASSIAGMICCSGHVCSRDDPRRRSRVKS
jgi:hypothetical protein